MDLPSPIDSGVDEESDYLMRREFFLANSSHDELPLRVSSTLLPPNPLLLVPLKYPFKGLVMV